MRTDLHGYIRIKVSTAAVFFAPMGTSRCTCATSTELMDGVGLRPSRWDGRSLVID